MIECIRLKEGNRFRHESRADEEQEIGHYNKENRQALRRFKADSPEVGGAGKGA